MATEDLRGLVAAEVAASTKRLATIIGNTPTVVFTVWAGIKVGADETRIVAPKASAHVAAVPRMVFSMLRRLEVDGHLGSEEVADTYTRAGDAWTQRLLNQDPDRDILVRVPITNGKGFVVLSRQLLLDM